jgi:hypothetical protein
LCVTSSSESSDLTFDGFSDNNGDGGCLFTEFSLEVSDTADVFSDSSVASSCFSDNSSFRDSQDFSLASDDGFSEGSAFSSVQFDSQSKCFSCSFDCTFDGFLEGSSEFSQDLSVSSDSSVAFGDSSDVNFLDSTFSSQSFDECSSDSFDSSSSSSGDNSEGFFEFSCRSSCFSEDFSGEFSQFVDTSSVSSDSLVESFFDFSSDGGRVAFFFQRSDFFSEDSDCFTNSSSCINSVFFEDSADFSFLASDFLDETSSGTSSSGFQASDSSSDDLFVSSHFDSVDSLAGSDVSGDTTNSGDGSRDRSRRRSG